MTHSTIAGTGGYLPERVMTNKEFEKIVDTSDEWIRERSGIKRRHIAADGETTSDMAVAAAREAISAAGIEEGDIDLIIVATTTPDKVFPSTACIVQRQLGIRRTAAFRRACGVFRLYLRAGHRGSFHPHRGRQLCTPYRSGNLLPHSRLE